MDQTRFPMKEKPGLVWRVTTSDVRAGFRRIVDELGQHYNPMMREGPDMEHPASSSYTAGGRVNIRLFSEDSIVGTVTVKHIDKPEEEGYLDEKFDRHHFAVYFHGFGKEQFHDELKSYEQVSYFL